MDRSEVARKIRAVLDAHPDGIRCSQLCKELQRRFQMDVMQMSRDEGYGGHRKVFLNNCGFGMNKNDDTMFEIKAPRQGNVAQAEDQGRGDRARTATQRPQAVVDRPKARSRALEQCDVERREHRPQVEGQGRGDRAGDPPQRPQAVVEHPITRKVGECYIREYPVDAQTHAESLRRHREMAEARKQREGASCHPEARAFGISRPQQDPVQRPSEHENVVDRPEHENVVNRPAPRSGTLDGALPPHPMQPGAENRSRPHQTQPGAENRPRAHQSSQSRSQAQPTFSQGVDRPFNHADDDDRNPRRFRAADERKESGHAVQPTHDGPVPLRMCQNSQNAVPKSNDRARDASRALPPPSIHHNVDTRHRNPLFREGSTSVGRTSSDKENDRRVSESSAKTASVVPRSTGFRRPHGDLPEDNGDLFRRNDLVPGFEGIEIAQSSPMAMRDRFKQAQPDFEDRETRADVGNARVELDAGECQTRVDKFFTNEFNPIERALVNNLIDDYVVAKVAFHTREEMIHGLKACHVPFDETKFPDVTPLDVVFVWKEEILRGKFGINLRTGQLNLDIVSKSYEPA